MTARHEAPDEEPARYDLHDQLDQAKVAVDRGSRWPALSYEEGVLATLRWLLGCTREKPMEDEGHE